MIIHLSTELRQRLPSALEPGGEIEVDPSWDSWHARLVTGAGQEFVLFCHDASRYALVLPGASPLQLADLNDWLTDLLLGCLAAEGFEADAIAQVARSAGPARLVAGGRASVVASLRSYRRRLLGLLSECSAKAVRDPIRISMGISHRPTRVRGRLVWPDKELAEMIQALQAQGSPH